MACREYEHRLNQLEDYLEDRLDAASAAQVAAHLGDCPACREAVESAQFAGGLLRAGVEPAAVPGDEFWLRVAAGIREAEERRQQFWAPLEVLARRVSWSATIAVALLAAFVLVSDLRWPGTETVPRNEVREIFPEPEQQPSNSDEVLLTLARNGR